MNIGSAGIQRKRLLIVVYGLGHVSELVKNIAQVTVRAGRAWLKAQRLLQRNDCFGKPA